MSKHAKKTVVLFLSLIFVMGFTCRAQNSQPTEYQIKAAFIYNFAKFVDWPAQAFASTNAPMVIGLLGDNVFDGYITHLISGREINGHQLQFEKFDSLAQITNCQVLFISASEKNHLPKILDQLRGTSTLTISEKTDDFIGDGGMIYLFLDDENKVRFQINNDAARKAGLTISSKLLSLAANNQ